MRSYRSSPVVVVFGCALLVASCAENEANEKQRVRDDNRGGVAITVSTKNLTLADVDGIRFTVVAEGAACTGPVLAERSVAFEPGEDAFADALFVLPPGSYKACALPLKAGVATARCGEASALVDVAAATTADVELLSQCTGDPTGGLAVVVELNQPPTITGLTLDPGKTLSVCETLSAFAGIDEPDGDGVTFQWEQVSGAASSHLESTSDQLRFWGPAGDYELKVTATDSHGASSSLQFPVRVVEATCAVPPAVQAIFTTQCGPCHTTGSSGGLKLDPSTLAYASLVNIPSSAAACATRTRVVPGDAEQSYLMAKLRGDVDICGTQMPRGRPPLAEADMQIIEDWINGLPF